MKIAIVASDYFPTIGGVQTAVHNIALQAQRQGHSAIILSSLPAGNVPAAEAVNDIQIHRFAWGRRPLWSLPWRALVSLWGMWHVLRRFNPDVVYVHFLTINALWVLLLHHLWRFKLVASSRGNDVQGIPQRSRVQRWMLPRLFQRANAIVFCSEFLIRDAVPFLRDVPTATPICVIGEGFDPQEFEGRRAFEYPAPYILGMARLVQKKGFDLLIQGFAKIADEFPRVHLLIAGDGEERRNLEQLIERLKMQGRIKLLGFADREKSVALFWGCEFFVLSSRVEPFGIVVLEAMWARKAVLATRCGRVIHLVQPGINGALVEIDADALAAGMREMLAHPEVTRAMGVCAPATIREHTWESVFRQYVELFERVQNSRG